VIEKPGIFISLISDEADLAEVFKNRLPIGQGSEGRAATRCGLDASILFWFTSIITSQNLRKANIQWKKKTQT
jgi:hypothetical protein